MKLHFYECVNRRCRLYHREFSTVVGPAGARAATGRPATCACGQPQRLKRTAPVRPESELARALTAVGVSS